MDIMKSFWFWLGDLGNNPPFSALWKLRKDQTDFKLEVINVCQYSYLDFLKNLTFFYFLHTTLPFCGKFLFISLFQKPLICLNICIQKMWRCNCFLYFFRYMKGWLKFLQIRTEGKPWNVRFYDLELEKSRFGLLNGHWIP